MPFTRSPTDPSAATALPPRGAAAFEQRDRFLAFAFAAADLLVEADMAGRITFAAGAFRSRFGQAPEAFTGRPLSCLVAAEDHGTLAMAINLLLARGRLAPLGIRLSDAERSAFSMAGLAPLGTGIGGRLCLTFGPVPALPESASLCAPEVFLREAELRVRAGVAGGPAADVMGLLELGPAATAALLGRPALAAEVGETFIADRSGALAGELGPGRYGVLPQGGEAPDLASLAARVELLLRSQGVSCDIVAQQVPLRADGLTGVQAVRALRYALGTFAREGTAGTEQRGFGNGLAACVAKVSTRAGVLRRMIEEGRFDLGFQPIVHLAKREVHHHEALIRPHAGVDADLATPQDFVLLAETVGLAENLDLAVAERVLRAAARSPVPLACNLSGQSVQSPGFRRKLLAQIDAAGGAAKRLMVEVTESSEIEDEAEAQATLAALRERGMQVCIDDFGAGAAAFRYLRTFRVDYVKVDGLYVRNAVRTERDRSFVAAMVDLSLAVGAEVIAERIETEEDARVMQSLGVHYGQGYLFGRAAPLPGLPDAGRGRAAAVTESWA
ncbi:EAL domain-containing protein [Roseomonas sp. BN140053]|uniref:EAL domain-containing protein n=1 Tax=Roseomonas sp. BN140053 TaxID=3391898 RepID=UPI0039E9F6F8